MISLMKRAGNTDKYTFEVLVLVQVIALSN